MAAPMDTAKKKKKEAKNRKVPASVFAAAQTPSRQHLKSRFFESDAFKKETVHKRHRRRSRILDFYPKDSHRS